MTRIGATFLTLLWGILFTASGGYAQEDPYAHLYNDPSAQAEFVEQKIREHFPTDVAEAMLHVANCESAGLVHWLPDGTLRPHDANESSARGVLQILFQLHGPDIQRMGLDMRNIDDYMQFARHLFDTQGPENAWSECTVQMSPTVLAMLR